MEATPKKSGIGKLFVRLLIILVFLVIFFAGLCVLLYPSVSNYINSKNASRVIDSYDTIVTEMTETDYSSYIEAAKIYNAALAAGTATVSDAFEAAEDDENRTDEYWSLLDPSGTGVMGYVVIDKVSIKLPIYHGTSESALAVGAGHLQGSSMPVGGESTHAIISAHTGLPSAELFTNVDQLQLGDTFQMHILGNVLTYEVDQILTVLPHEIDSLNIVKGEDYCTLVTCTPYGVNSHRLLIRGTRIENPEVTETDDDDPQVGHQPEAPKVEAEEATGFEKLKQKAFLIFADIFEKLATWFVAAAEWAMNLFGIEY